jgi:YfiH family protein
MQAPSEQADRLTSPLLSEAGFAHAFFTRRGGVSQPPWSSLNFGTSDERASVHENLARAARALGVAPERVHYLSQVHGTGACVVDASSDRELTLRTEGDITLSTSPLVACGVRSADCVTVLVGCRRTGAVAAIHSGWRGTAANVAAHGVEALRELIGGPPDAVAAIGPHIERCCFEVDEDVAAELSGCSSLGARAIERADGRARVDLRAIVRAQLEAAGVSGAAIDDVHGCTVCDAERFYSFRRDKDESGRMLAAIVAR